MGKQAKILILLLGVIYPGMLVYGEIKDDDNLANVDGENAKALAKKAYFTLEESPFDREVYRQAGILLNSANSLNDKEPWVYIGLSLATMQHGYKKGSWFRQKSFSKRSVDKAFEHAKKAVELGPNESQSYAHLARMYIIKKEYRKAWGELNTSYALDNNNFYAWFYKGLVYYYMKGYEKAVVNLDEAEKNIIHRYHKKLVTRQRQRVARKMGDKELEEKMYKKNIQNFPDNAYMYGNYAGFLFRNKRYEKAAEFYEKAINIKPYAHAQGQLIKAKIKARE